MVGERRIERHQHAPKAWMRPLHHSPKLDNINWRTKLERRARVERATRGFADRRLTDRLPSRTGATNLGLKSGIGPEVVRLPCVCSAIELFQPGAPGLNRTGVVALRVRNSATELRERSENRGSNPSNGAGNPVPNHSAIPAKSKRPPSIS